MSSLAGPPRYVPTLTEVVEPLEVVHPISTAETISYPRLPGSNISAQAHEEIVQQILHRIEGMLEPRLHRAIELAMLDHMRILVSGVHKEIEAIVRESVAQALKETL